MERYMDKLYKIIHDGNYNNIFNTVFGIQAKELFDFATNNRTPYRTSFHLLSENNNPYELLHTIASEGDYQLFFVQQWKQSATLLLLSKEQETHIEVHIKLGPQLTDFMFVVFCADYSQLEFQKKKILSLSNLKESYLNFCQIEWASDGMDDFREFKLYEDLKEEFFYEAYPSHPNLESRVNQYLESTTPLMLIKGVPGTGKTRLVREIVRQFGRKYNKMPVISYTTDQSVLKEDSFFIDFMMGDKDILLLEDIDFNLMNRTEGNFVMPKFLNTSDGFIRLRNNKKIIFTTNIIKTDKIDQALIRAGRCFGVLNFSALTPNQSQEFYTFLGNEDNLPKGSYTVADIFSYHRGEKKYEKQLDKVVGFR